MSTKFKLSVSSPCSEKFENFQKTEVGGFCNSCSKEVTDFTSMNDQEIIEYFTNQNGKTCGRFTDSQLKLYENFMANGHKSSPAMLSIFGLTLMSLLTTSPSIAQEKKPLIEVTSNTNKVNLKPVNQTYGKGKLVKGIVTDIDGTLPGVSILLKGTTIGTETDFDGKFTFPKPLKKGDILVFSYLGYKTQEVTVKGENIEIELKMEPSACIVMGEVKVEKLHKSNRSVWKRVRKKKSK